VFLYLHPILPQIAIDTVLDKICQPDDMQHYGPTACEDKKIKDLVKLAILNRVIAVHPWHGMGIDNIIDAKDLHSFREGYRGNSIWESLRQVNDMMIDILCEFRRF